MFDLILTILHVLMLAGAILVSLIVLKRSRNEKKDSSTSFKVKLLLFFFLLPSGVVFGQVPQLSKGREIWSGSIHGAKCRLVQIPASPMVLTPVRFCLEGLDSNARKFFDELDYAEISAKPGNLTERVFAPQRSRFFQWNERLLEVRQSFEMGGDYILRLHTRQSSTPDLSITLRIAPLEYLSFEHEILLFVGGCLLLGGFLFQLWIILRRRVDSSPLVIAK